MIDQPAEAWAGWWDITANRRTLINTVTDERVALAGPVQVDGTAKSDTWLRFDYEHADLRFPVLVESTSRQPWSPPQDKFEQWLVEHKRKQNPRMRFPRKTESEPPAPEKPKAIVSWRIDYNRSAALWRREASIDGPWPPPYGVWRRVDDCLTDALACWPELNSAGTTFGRYLLADGGWLNGRWRHDMYRSFGWIQDSVIPLSWQRGFIAEDDWLMPLDTTPPVPWEFHDLPSPSNHAEAPRIGAPHLEIADNILPEGCKSIPFKHQWDFPHSTGFDGIAGRTPYLVTRDGRRILYVYHGALESGLRIGHGGRPKFSLLYADNEVVCSFAGQPDFSSDPGTGQSPWTINSRYQAFGVRSPAVDPMMSLVPNQPHPIYEPTRRHWLRSYWALADGWLNWRGSKARHPKWERSLNLLGAHSLRIDWGYVAGQTTHNKYTKIQTRPFTD